MTKKIFCIMLALMMVATMFLTGCKDADEDKPNSSTPVESLDSSEDVSEETSTPDSSATVSGDESNDSSEDISDETSDISDESSEDISDESSEEMDSSEPDSSVADEPDDSSAPEVPDDSSTPVEEPDESEVPDDSSVVVCNHNYISTTTPATCISAGKTEEKCSLCGDVKSSNTIAALGHDYKTTQNGNTTVKTCQRCGDTKTETTGSCNGNHSYEKVKTVPATCQAIGYTEYKCSKCGAVDKRDVTAQLFHDYQFTKTVAPTATTEGYDLYTCTLCGHGDKRFVKPATGETNTGYSCGVEGHVCESAEDHELVVAWEAEGCTFCGSHSCSSFYEYSGKYDHTHCPEYDVTNDYSYYCQNCHLPRGEGPGYCSHNMLGYDATCKLCNTFVPGGSCHHCTVAPPEAELVTFTFDANGGSLNGFPETIVGTKDGSVLLSNYPSPVRDGYIFRGWAITKTVPMDLWEFYVCAAASVSWGMNYYAIWEKA